MKKTCENCFCYHKEQTDEGERGYCYFYDCWTEEVVKEKENPSCWEDFPPDYYDSQLYCELYGCDP